MGKWCLLTSRKLVSTSSTKSVRRPEWFFSLRLRVQSDASHWTRRVVYTANTSWCPTHIFSWARDCAFRVSRSSCLVWKARVILLSRTHFVYDAGAQHPACSFSVTTPVVALTQFVSAQLHEISNKRGHATGVTLSFHLSLHLLQMFIVFHGGCVPIFDVLSLTFRHSHHLLFFFILSYPCERRSHCSCSRHCWLKPTAFATQANLWFVCLHVLRQFLLLLFEWGQVTNVVAITVVLVLLWRGDLCCLVDDQSACFVQSHRPWSWGCSERDQKI